MGFDCASTASECYTSAIPLFMPICGTTNGIREENVFFDSSYPPEACFNFSAQVLRPFFPSVQSNSVAATSTEISDNNCGCNTILDALFDLAVPEPSKDTQFCTGLLNTIFSRLQDRACKSVKILGKLGNFLCDNVAGVVLDIAKTIVEKGWATVCNVAVDYISKALGIDINAFYALAAAEFETQKAKVVSAACGALTCATSNSVCAITGPAGGQLITAVIAGVCTLLGNGAIACSTPSFSFLLAPPAAALLVQGLPFQ